MKTQSKGQRRCQTIQDKIDMFGEPVRLTFEGNAVYSTKMGMVFSIIMIIFMLIIGIVKLLDFQRQEQAFQLINRVPFYNQPLKLAENHFFFAVQRPDEEYGRIEVSHVQWPAEGEKTKTEIDMIDCAEYEDKSSHYYDTFGDDAQKVHDLIETIKITQLRNSNKYICPKNPLPEI